jgi:carboxypeptidase family protein
VLFTASLFAQNEAALSGTVLDPDFFVIQEARLTLVDNQRGKVRQTTSNAAGIFLFGSLPPGEYTLEVSKAGFSKLKMSRVLLTARDRRTMSIELQVAEAETAEVTVSAAVEGLSSDPSNGVTVSYEYSKDLPLNARDVNSVALMTPGVLNVPSGPGGGGLNVNGLRSNANYYTLDGVSANISAGGGRGPGGGGGPRRGGGPVGGGGGGGVAGGAGLMSIEGMQEVRVQASSFSPEFGRSPGAQISMTSRSGSNDFHGSAYFYYRDERFNANDWFANSTGLGRAEMNHKNYGATIGGPLVRDKTFFFATYEGLRLDQPVTAIVSVPNMEVREAADPSLKSYLDAYPIPNGVELEDGAAQFAAIYSSPISRDSASIRIDHNLNDRMYFFARYSYSPTDFTNRGSVATTPNVVNSSESKAQTFTASLIWTPSVHTTNDLRLNISTSRSESTSLMDDFGGAVPLTDELVFPDGIDSGTGRFGLSVMGLSGYSYGAGTQSKQHQINIVDSMTHISGRHSWKLGADYRRLAPTLYNTPYNSSATFNGLDDGDGSLLSGVSLNSLVSSSELQVFPTYVNFSLYFQDMWKATERTTITWGLRWDINPAPGVREGPAPFAALGSGFSTEISRLDPLYHTRWFDVAPRLGLAYQLDTTPGREMMFRAGVGLFYDLGYGTVSSAFMGAPYVNQNVLSEAEFPLSEEDRAPPGMPATKPYGQVSSADSYLESPQVIQWSATVERLFGHAQSFSVGYVGTKGRKLIQNETARTFSGDVDILRKVANGAESDYHGLQVQFRRRFASNFQTQLSYTYGHSIDTASNDFSMGGFGGFGTLRGSERGSSDHDVRHNLNFSGSYLAPSPQGGFLRPLLKDWWIEWVVTARTGLPFDVVGVTEETEEEEDEDDEDEPLRGLFAQGRPNYTGEPVWISDSNVPGGKRLNPDAFEMPDEYEQGNLGHNIIRGFNSLQVDLSVRREIPLSERFRLSVILQAFNVLNHPNFANPSRQEGASMASSNFGVATSMLNQAYGRGANSTYQVGGPRTLQLALRLQF